MLTDHNGWTANLNQYYSRVSGDVDFNVTGKTTLIAVGTGASGAAIEAFFRLGMKRGHLFDLDIVEKKNLTSQNFTHTDVGLAKTEALKRRLLQCEFEPGNPAFPAAQIFTYGDFLAIDDEEISALIKAEQAAGQRVILLMASDFHPVQARGNRIALAHGLTVFWVGIYRNGAAGEIIFHDGATTSAPPDKDGAMPCYRCITETRYNFWDKHHLADHQAGAHKKGAGRSAGLPMAASFIDSILGHLIIGAIHAHIDDNPHARLYRRLVEQRRNFIQTQLNPDYRLGDEDLFEQIRGPDVVTFNTLFQRAPVIEHCPDCGGLLSDHAPQTPLFRCTDYTRET